MMSRVGTAVPDPSATVVLSAAAKRTPTAAACASNPSANAMASMVGASAASPAGDSSCHVIFRW